MPQKRLFGVSLLQTVSRRYYFRARFPVVLCKSVFHCVFVEIHFFCSARSLTHAKNDVCFLCTAKTTTGTVVFKSCGFC